MKSSFRLPHNSLTNNFSIFVTDHIRQLMRSTAEEAHPQKLQGERQLIHLPRHSRLPDFDFDCDSVGLSMSGNHAGNALHCLAM